MPHNRLKQTAAVTFAAILALAALPSPIAAEPSSRKIVVGEGIAGINIGMTADEVIAVAGEPVSANRQPNGALIFLAYDPPGIFGVYFNAATGRVRLIVLARTGYCTRHKVCLGAPGQVEALRQAYGDRLLRFNDQDGSLTYRLLNDYGDHKILSEFTPSKDEDTLEQVIMLDWDGDIDTSSMANDGPPNTGDKN